MNPILNNLSLSINSKNEEKIKEDLQLLISQGKNLELTNLNIISPLFQHSSKEILLLLTEAIAELAKVEENRNIFTVGTVVRFLTTSLGETDDSLIIQTCRALCNICFDNENARTLIGSEGLLTLISVIKQNSLSKNFKLLNVAYACMLNLLMGNDELQKLAVKCDIITSMEVTLKLAVTNLVENEDCCLHILLTLNILTDHLVDTQLSDDFCCVLIDILKVSNHPEICVISLEILHLQLENNDIKILLAKKGVCELVFELVEKYKHQVDDEDSRAALKMACDIIVLILTGDEPMDLLYNNGNGVLFKNMLTWLRSDDFDLLSTGILAIGNFARNDAHCIQMVQNGIAKHLLDLLSRHNTIEKDVKVQHAILGALRNLVILPQNKAPILHEGLVPILYPMLDIKHSHVIFKLIGTLRIVIDGQETAALDLIMRRDLLTKIVEWSNNTDHLGVRGEASRFLAWLIKHCHSSKPFAYILETKDCVKCLVDMISSNHSVMQNEAFYAITLLCANCYGDQTNSDCIEEAANTKLDTLLIEANTGKNLSFLVNKYKDKFERETVLNLLTLVENLTNSPSVVKHLKETNLHENLHQLLQNGKVSDVHDRIMKLANTIDSG
ncbi:hypothetical protein RI129_010827 [Pyrocoelia pectoralis]|uniref:Rap1 GTPase-GDP dissociation stimulator 1 n=1 Tax=Pyrocoelia pectoralis TaxID=417401 RepID=A0AAN7V6Z2_9COLE